MIFFNYTIRDPLGMHARATGLVVEAAQKYRAKGFIECKGKIAALHKLVSIMALDVRQGDEITVYLEGPDEAEASQELETLFQQQL